MKNKKRGDSWKTMKVSEKLFSHKKKKQKTEQLDIKTKLNIKHQGQIYQKKRKKDDKISP